MEDFEKLGAFYLGRPYDLKEKKPKAGLLLYDSKDLVTHAICLGMTGSGKTGMCISLIEEAALDGIPSIIIDPKGDLANLLLTFPELRPDDFAPWINEEDAQRKGLSTSDYAAKQAELWKNGLAEWGQDGARIKRLKDAADFRIYTPGSNAGLPVSILKSFAAPPSQIIEDGELLTERVNTTATSLLGLLGIDPDPIKSREHILLSNILSKEWSAGRDLDIAALIQQIQSPSFNRIGVMDLDSFFPPKDRFELSMSLNNLLAAPAFAAYTEGEPLDIQNILYTSSGKPRVSIFSIAHLNDAQRMFFVSLLLNQMLGWMRTQSGTTSLRAILYMDEIFGYFPPVANPPTKVPLLTLLKQGRAFGLGVVLATQNPVDLDYKGLANTGTWIIGRLQTERDKARILEGLEGVAGGTGLKFDRQEMEQTLAGLESRIFVLNNVHEEGTEIFETRWAMSYLRGPLTRNQIKTLMDPVKSSTGTDAPRSSTADTSSPPPASPATDESAKTQEPLLPPEVPRYFVPVRNNGKGSLVYHPMLLGAAEVRFSDKRVDTTKDISVIAPIAAGVMAIDWESAAQVDLPISDLEQEPTEGAKFVELPAAAAKPKNYDKWERDFANWLYRGQKLELLKSERLKQSSNPGESERDFRVRLQQSAREQRDAAVEKLRKKYAPKIAALEEKRRRAEQAVERETEQASGQKMQTAISFGATLLSSFMGRKAVSLTTLGRATSAARGVGRAMKESQDIGRAQETVAAMNEQLAELDEQFKDETVVLEKNYDAETESLETVTLKPTKANISVKILGLVWTPYWHTPDGEKVPAWQ